MYVHFITLVTSRTSHINGSQNHYFNRTHEAKTVGPTLFHIFVKHWRKFLYAFEGPIISMNILHRKRRGLTFTLVITTVLHDKTEKKRKN